MLLFYVASFRQAGACQFRTSAAMLSLCVSNVTTNRFRLPRRRQAHVSTRLPVSVASLLMLGYFQMMIWFWEYPCVDTISFTLRDHEMLHTCRRRGAGPEARGEWTGWGATHLRLAGARTGSWSARHRLLPHTALRLCPPPSFATSQTGGPLATSRAEAFLSVLKVKPPAPPPTAHTSLIICSPRPAPPGCPCPHSAGRCRWRCSRSGCSGPPCRRRWPAGRAGGETTRWPGGGGKGAGWE